MAYRWVSSATAASFTRSGPEGRTLAEGGRADQVARYLIQPLHCERGSRLDGDADRSVEPFPDHICHGVTQMIWARGYSPFHFARKFTFAMGISPRYISRIRLENAMAELAVRKLPLAQIALNAQFSSQASFTRMSSCNRHDTQGISAPSTLAPASKSGTKVRKYGQDRAASQCLRFHSGRPLL